MQWYLMIDSQQKGPVNETAAKIMAKAHPDAYCWRAGLSEWIPVSSLDMHANDNKNIPPPFEVSGESNGKFGSNNINNATDKATNHTDDSTADMSSSNSNLGNSTGKKTNQTINQTVSPNSTELKYTIYGDGMQYVEFELEPDKSLIAEAGTMIYKDPKIVMDTVWGDGSLEDTTGSFFDKILDTGMRIASGDNICMTKFTHKGQDNARIAFGAEFAGTIIPIRLSDYDGSIICQKSSFLVGRYGIEVSTHFQKTILTGLLGGEGFVMQRLKGEGVIFIHAGGTLREFDLAKDETLNVDTGCLVAVTETVQYDVVKAGGIKSVMLAGEGVFFAKLQGPGKVWIQSLPFSRLAGRVLYASSKRSIKGEGSPLNILGGLGEKLDGSKNKYRNDKNRNSKRSTNNNKKP